MDKSVNRKKKRSEFKIRGPKHEPVLRVAGWKTRVVRGKYPDRQFDIDFWQEQGAEAIFAAAWEMICFTEDFKHGKQPTFQRTVTNFKLLQKRSKK